MLTREFVFCVGEGYGVEIFCRSGGTTSIIKLQKILLHWNEKYRI